MKTSTFLTTTCIVCTLAICATFYFTKKHIESELMPAQTTKTQAAVDKAVQTPIIPVTGVASGKDTIVMVFNKENAKQIIIALQSQFPTTQNAPNLTVQQFVATQNVFNYLGGLIFKKWPDLAPKPSQPMPAAQTKTK